MVEVDPEENCKKASTGEVITSDVESETKVCGEVMTVEEDGSTNYDLADQNENFGSRQVYVQGTSWWYEDYPNLDLSHERVPRIISTLCVNRKGSRMAPFFVVQSSKCCRIHRMDWVSLFFLHDCVGLGDSHRDGANRSLVETAFNRI